MIDETTASEADACLQPATAIPPPAFTSADAVAPSENQPVSIAGLRVLVAEDEPLIAMVLEDILEDLQCIVVGPHASLAATLAVVDEAAFDLALLDVNLRGGESYPVAEALDRRAIPFAFMTGQDTSSLPEAFRARPNLSKPYAAEDVDQVIRSLAGNR